MSSGPPDARFTRGRAWVDVKDFPAEALRLLEAQDAEGPRGAPPGAPRGTDGLRERLRTGAQPGLLLIGPKDEAVGLATWDPPAELGRRASVYLADGYRNPAVLGRTVDALRAADPSPLLSLRPPSPGLPHGGDEEALARRGFFRLRRSALVLPLDRSARGESQPEAPARRVGPSDLAALAELLERAYRADPWERAVFATRRDPAEDARGAVERTLDGDFGTFLPAASFGVERDGRLVAATLLTDADGPRLAQVMVDPEERRRGLARRLIRRSVDAVRSSAPSAIRLTVSDWNRAAGRLYRSLGFVDDPSAALVLWLDLAALGLAPPPGSADRP